MKKCFKCGTEKPLDDFYVHPQMGDKHLNKCKECTKLDATRTRRANEDYYRAYDTARAKLPHRLLLSAKIRDRNRSKPGVMSAHNAVARALKSGVLKRKPCEMCGRENDVLAHHDDYTMPLAVMWLCPVHHASRHSFLSVMFPAEQKAA